MKADIATFPSTWMVLRVLPRSHRGKRKSTSEIRRGTVRTNERTDAPRFNLINSGEVRKGKREGVPAHLEKKVTVKCGRSGFEL